MRTWTPLLAAVVLAILLNAAPVLLAFMVNAPGWREGGWAYYFLTLPAGVVIVAMGLIISWILHRRRHKTASTPASGTHV